MSIDEATKAGLPWYRTLNATQWKTLLASNLGVGSGGPQSGRKRTEVAYHCVRNLLRVGDARGAGLNYPLGNDLRNGVATVNQVKHPQRLGIGDIQPVDV